MENTDVLDPAFSWLLRKLDQEVPLNVTGLIESMAITLNIAALNSKKTP